jgi:hypothetical protein
MIGEYPEMARQGQTRSHEALAAALSPAVSTTPKATLPPHVTQLHKPLGLALLPQEGPGRSPGRGRSLPDGGGTALYAVELHQRRRVLSGSFSERGANRRDQPKRGRITCIVTTMTR